MSMMYIYNIVWLFKVLTDKKKKVKLISITYNHIILVPHIFKSSYIYFGEKLLATFEFLGYNH